jgi:hypothetical protein
MTWADYCYWCITTLFCFNRFLLKIISLNTTPIDTTTKKVSATFDCRSFLTFSDHNFPLQIWLTPIFVLPTASNPSVLTPTVDDGTYILFLVGGRWRNIAGRLQEDVCVYFCQWVYFCCCYLSTTCSHPQTRDTRINNQTANADV